MQVENKLRAAQRYFLMGADCIVETKSEKHFGARIVDLSINGAQVYSKNQLGSSGDIIEVYLRLNLGEEDHVFSLKSVITNVRMDKGFKLFKHGIKFIEVDHKAEILLKNYIYKSMTE